MFEWSPVFRLVLKISFNPTPDATHKRSGVSEVLPEEGLKVNPGPGSYFFLDLMLVLVSAKTDPTSKKQCKV